MNKTITPAFPIIVETIDGKWFGAHCELSSSECDQEHYEFSPIYLQDDRVIDIDASQEVLSNGLYKPFGDLLINDSVLELYTENKRQLKFSLKGFTFDGKAGKSDSSGVCAQLMKIANLNYSKGDGNTVFFTGRSNGLALSLDFKDKKAGIKSLIQKLLYSVMQSKPLFINEQDIKEIKADENCFNLDYFDYVIEQYQGIEESFKPRQIANFSSQAIELVNNAQKFNEFQMSDVAKIGIYYFTNETFAHEGYINTLLQTLGLPYFSQDQAAKDFFNSLYERIVPPMVHYDISPEDWEEARSSFLERQMLRPMKRGNDGLIDKILHEDFAAILNATEREKIDQYKHILISGPTGTGKTELASALMLNKLLSPGAFGSSQNKGLYLGPIKALIEQIQGEWNKQFGELLQPLLNNTRQKTPVILSTGDYSADDHRIRGDADDYAIACVVNEKANIFASTIPGYIQSLRCVIIDEVHMVNHEDRIALDLLIGKLQQEADRRKANGSAPLTLICITTEKSDFTDVLKSRGISEPWSLSTTHRPVRSTHYLCVMPNNEHVAFEKNVTLADTRVRLADMKNDSARYRDISEFEDDVISKCNQLLKQNYNDLSNGVKKNTIEQYARYVEKIKSGFNGGKRRAVSLLICAPGIEMANSLADLLIVNRGVNPFDEVIGEELDNFETEVKRAGLPKDRSDKIIDLGRRGVFLHNSKLPFNVKKFVLELFSNRSVIEKIRRAELDLIVIATETLAYGINLSTDLLILLNYQFPRAKNSLPLTANEYHNIVGRAGRYGKNSDDELRAEVYLCMPAQKCLPSLKAKTKDSVLNQMLAAFLRAMYCEIPSPDKCSNNTKYGQERRLKKNLSGLFINTVGKAKQKEDRTDLLQHILIHEAEESFYTINSDNFTADEFNRNLHTFLDAIWYYSGGKNIDVTLSAAINESLMKSFYINRTFVNSPFNDIEVSPNNRAFNWSTEDFFNAFIKVGYYILGTSDNVRKETDHNFEGQHSFIKGLKLIKIKNSSSDSILYQMTKSGESLLATGTHFNTAKAIELWVRLISGFTKQCNSAPVELFLPALVYPDEVFSQFDRIIPEIRMFVNTKKSTNFMIPDSYRLFIDKNYRLLENKLKEILSEHLGLGQVGDVDLIDNFFAAINFSLTGPLTTPKEFDTKVINDICYLFTEQGGFYNINCGESDPDLTMKVKKSAFYRAIIICYMWLNEESLAAIGSEGCQIEESLFDYIENDKKREELRAKCETIQDFSPNTGVHSQLIYKANNLINYFSGRDSIEDSKDYSVMSILDFNVSTFERRMRYGCRECNLPIATALQNQWSRHEFCNNIQRNGYHDLYTMYNQTENETINGVENYWGLLRRHFSKSFEAMNRGLIRGLLDHQDQQQLAVVELWNAFELMINRSAFDEDARRQFINLANNDEFLDRIRNVHTNYFGPVNGLNQYILFHDEPPINEQQHQITIYAYLVLTVLIARDLNDEKIRSSYIWDMICTTPTLITTSELLKLDCWKNTPVLSQLKSVIYNFDEPIRPIGIEL
ncbi:MAG: DEAD/DEAH box helicase [Cognaticolwellia aestuarii]